MNIHRTLHCAALAGLVLTALGPARPAISEAAAPVITSLTATNENHAVKPGEYVTIIVHAEDPDCAGTCSAGCGMVVVSERTVWLADGGTLSERDDGATGSPYTASVRWEAPSAVGRYAIDVSVSDNGESCGGDETATVSIHFVVNNPPVALSDLIIGDLTEDSPGLAEGNLLSDNGYGRDYDVDGDEIYIYGYYGNWPLPDDGSFVCDSSRDFEICINMHGDVTCESFNTWNDLSEGEFAGLEYEYWLTDGKSINERAFIDSHYGKVACVIRGENDPVTAVDSTLFLPEDYPARSFSVVFDDPDWNDEPSFSFDCASCRRPGHGVVAHTGGDRGEYRPERDYAGEDSFGFEVCDDFSCDTGLVLVTVEPRDDPPTADAGGAYDIPSGEGILFDGSGSTDPDFPQGDTLSFAWDLDGDGSFDDAAQETVLLTGEELSEAVCGGTCVLDSPYEVTLRVTDGTGMSDTDSTTLTVTGENTAVVRGDMNADGRPDLLWRNGSTGANYIWYMDGAAVVGGASLPSVSDPHWEIAAREDFNEDEKPDLLWRHRSAGINYLWYMNGPKVTGVAALPPEDAEFTLDGAGDFNLDGHPDLLWRHRVNGAMHIWYMDGESRKGSAPLPSAPPGWAVADVNDFSGDGRPDFLWRHRASGAIYIWFMVDTAVTGGAPLQPAPPEWKIEGTADFNGDGSPDLCWRNYVDGANHLWYMDGPVAVGAAALPKIPDTDWSMGQ